ncbi:hypothetical protein F4780DRAFT_741998 [Xylariomycetidae sp. FL0641]|nr:hypothetical protein F4780DRAFT_741998 [Xylariomycetidae sp. FL0641]
MAPANGAATEHSVPGYLPGPSASLTASDLKEIAEYRKIIDFRDTVVSGKHPRIKVPQSTLGKGKATSRPSTFTSADATARVAPSPTAAHVQNNIKPASNGYQMGNMQSFKANSERPAVPVAPNGPGSGLSSATFIPGMSSNFAAGAGQTKINPVLLEKSDGLIKAEFQLQRQRVEKLLKEQLDQQRAAAKNASHPSDQIPDFDIADILAKARTLVQATAPPPNAAPAADASLPANQSDASDSFDENTFYSSQHDTPEFQPSPARSRGPQDDVQMQDASPVASQPNFGPAPPPALQQPTARPIPVPAPVVQQASTVPDAFPIQDADIPSPYQTGRWHPSLQDNFSSNVPQRGTAGGPARTHRADVDAQFISSDSGAASRSDNSGNTDSDQPADHRRKPDSQQLLPSATVRHGEPPLVRAHDLLPYAPQPAHVSPLTFARQQQTGLPDAGVSIQPGAPAQVTALRHEHAVVSSPESSPQGDKGSKKKKKNKNKKRAEARAQGGHASPDIKPEPRSVSPVTAPHFARPHKRQRPSGRQEPVVIYDEPRIERPVSVLHRERYPTAPLTVDGPPLGLEIVDDPYTRQVRHSVAPTSHRVEAPVYEERRPDGTIVQYIRRVQSPAGYSLPYGTTEPRPLRTSSYSVASPSYRELPAYHREGRMSTRPYADRARSRSPIIVERRSPAMAPPSAPPTRIVVDEYGREYMEPPPISSIARRSVVPPARPGDKEVIYERASMRAPSRMLDRESYGDNLAYGRSTPSFTQRRVITQPEYGADSRSYRERDYYSTQPMGPPSQDFVQIRGTTERRMVEPVSREYPPRSASVRPVESASYYDRLSSAQYDAPPPRQYASSVHPETRREEVRMEMAPPALHGARDFSVRPNDTDMARREYNPGPRREAAPPLTEDFNVRPVDSGLPQREYSVRPVERFYDPPPPREEGITYIERPRQEVIYMDDGRRQVYMQ